MEKKPKKNSLQLMQEKAAETAAKRQKCKEEGICYECGQKLPKGKLPK